MTNKKINTLFKARNIHNSETEYGFYWTNTFGDHMIKSVVKDSSKFLKDYKVDVDTLEYMSTKDIEMLKLMEDKLYGN